jgi:NAD(P)-dependent dehydrogenase (short-subunit alcohol dehydrogenase family)
MTLPWPAASSPCHASPWDPPCPRARPPSVPFWLTRAALPAMLERDRGAVISIGSVASRLGLPYVAAYTAAKHALLGLTRSLSAEYVNTGITFNCVCPHYADTPMTRKTVRNIVARTGRTEQEALARILPPQGRLIEPDDVAAMCVFLASPAGRSITGQAINIDGGMLPG